jgi:hypothetical protein
MRPNPAEEWLRLTRLYGGMSDGQLLELAESYSDLTELARPILRDELKKRGLDDPQVALQSPSDRKDLPAFARISPRFADSASPADEPEEEQDDAPDHEYTWKTDLCSCSTAEEAWQIRETLRVAGVESWENRASSMFGSQDIQILVAADQLEDARAILARPIPQDIVDQSKTPVEDFVPPSCPKCGAPDPLLESVETVNTWRCEICNATWTDSTAFNNASSNPVS